MSATHGFQLIKSEYISEINGTAHLYRHLRTGAELMSVEVQDENKVFGASFRTPSLNSTGVAHIMEHSVLCGSRKYPVKEPFVELLKGSLQTFLNAFTYPDRTCYPTASQNLQDFYNLVDVYLDAVFHPLLTPEKLAQEGWHYDFNPETGKIGYKGVVYNEMKGAYSSPDSLLMENCQHALFPDTPYGVDSGGHPRHIPDLTFEAFEAFHRKFYHPSNAFLWFYGDDDPIRRLEILDSYLSEYEALEVDSAIWLQPPFDSPRRREVPYPAEAGAGAKAMATVNWVLPQLGASEFDPKARLTLDILNHILLGMPASPLRKALIESGLGEDLAGGGLETDLRQPCFLIGLKGVEESRVDEVEPLVDAILTRIATEGLDPATVAASLNTVEFALRENNTGSFPRGLSLMLRWLAVRLYGGDPFAPLAFEAPLAGLKADLAADPRLFEDVIRRVFLENPHRAVVILRPDPELAGREEAALAQALQAAEAALGPDGLAEARRAAEALELAQETPDSPEALASIPMLAVSDLPRENKLLPCVHERVGGTDLYTHDLFTNGVVYLDLGLDLRRLPVALLPYAPILGRALLETGAGDLDFTAFSQRIGAQTGGIHTQPMTLAVKGRPDCVARLFLRAKALEPKFDALLDILSKALTSPRLDDIERLRRMILEEKARCEQRIIPAGHRIIDARLRARFHEADHLSEQMHGVSQLLFLRELAARMEIDPAGVSADLKSALSAILSSAGLIVNLTAPAAVTAALRPALSAFLANLPSGPAPSGDWPAFTPVQAAPEALLIQATVNYVGKAANLPALGFTPNGAHLAIARYLRASYLWDRVRVRGGAYGAFCSLQRLTGTLVFASYRDPNLAATLTAYDEAADFLRQPIAEAELIKSVVGAIGDLDTYLLPDAKGFTSLLQQLGGEIDADRQLVRERILSVTPTDFREFADIIDAVARSGQIAVLGAEKGVDEAGLDVTKVKVL